MPTSGNPSLLNNSINIAIVGGGAAGLIAAITAAEAGAAVTLFEKNSDVGKKILASGNGRCNISNTSLHTANYFGTRHAFVSDALHRFDFHHFQKFCRSIGLFLEIKPDHRVYPLTNEAKTVKMLLQERAEALHVNIQCDHEILSVEKNAESFSLRSKHGEHKGFDALIITTGSEAAPQLGGCDDGYRFAESFGHEIEPTYPSLVQLHLASEIPARLAGVKCVGEVTLYVDREKRAVVSGDLLFTRYGISGFAILDISQGASEALIQGSQVAITLNLLPQFALQELGSQLGKLTASMPQRSIAQLLSGLIATKIVPYLLESCRIDPQTRCESITTKQLKQLLHAMTQWRFDVSDTHGFKHAEVSGGGISTEMIDSKSMQSKLVENLYFAGEVLDVVGARGGYNLHFAWASGYLAAKAATTPEK